MIVALTLDTEPGRPTLANGVTERVSVSTSGKQGRLDSFSGAMPRNGRYVVFDLDANNLVANYTNSASDVSYVRGHRSDGPCQRWPQRAAGPSRELPGLDLRNGRYVLFNSDADNLCRTTRIQDVFVRDVQESVTRRVSVRTGGRQANGPSFGGSITADGRLIAFSSDATNLVPDDTNFTTDVFIRDRREGKTERLVLAPPGGSPDSGSVGAVLSADGRFIAVSALGSFDAFIVDRRGGKTRLINQPLTGALQPFRTSFALAVSRDGRRVAFQSDASNLVAGDTNDRLDVFVRELSPW